MRMGAAARLRTTPFSHTICIPHFPKMESGDESWVPIDHTPPTPLLLFSMSQCPF